MLRGVVVSVLLVGWAAPLAYGDDKKELAPARLQALWNDLAGSDEVKAARALLALARSPDVAVKLLEKELRPVKVDARRAAKLLEDLDADEFAVRERASKELEYLGRSVKPHLEKALEKTTSAEVKKRLADLLKKLPADGKAATPPPPLRGRSISTRIINGEIQIYVDGKKLDLTPRTVAPTGPAPGQLRAARAVALLESIGTARARELLQKMADGEPDALPTKEAKAALARMKE